MPNHDPSLDLIKAQVAFRLLRGDTWEAIMKWWRKRYPREDVALAFEARDDAERAADLAARFRKLDKGQKLSEIVEE